MVAASMFCRFMIYKQDPEAKGVMENTALMKQ
jgi:hypothetical protein